MATFLIVAQGKNLDAPQLGNQVNSTLTLKLLATSVDTDIATFSYNHACDEYMFNKLIHLLLDIAMQYGNVETCIVFVDSDDMTCVNADYTSKGTVDGLNLAYEAVVDVFGEHPKLLNLIGELAAEITTLLVPENIQNQYNSFTYMQHQQGSKDLLKVDFSGTTYIFAISAKPLENIKQMQQAGIVCLSEDDWYDLFEEVDDNATRKYIERFALQANQQDAANLNNCNIGDWIVPLSEINDGGNFIKVLPPSGDPSNTLIYVHPDGIETEQFESVKQRYNL